jgi:hypothetical protein
MTDYTWTGAVSTASSTAGNWSPAAVPTASDNVIFDNTASVDCVWTLTAINNITLDATAYNFVLDTSALTVTGVFHLDGNIAVDGSRVSVLVKFTGSGETLITFDDETAWVNGDTDKAKTTFEILGTGTNIMFQNGEYPIVKIGTSTTVSPHVPSAPNNTYTETDFYQLTFAATGKFAETSALVYSSDPKLERSKVFRIRSIGTWSVERFEGGKAIWIFYATTAGFELPLSGSNLSTATSFEGKVAQIKVVATVIGQKIKVPPGPHYLEKLTIDAGVMCLCDRSIAELHMTNRPIIDGAWQFVQITDGIYRSAKEDMILPITHGGTGQKNAQDAINALTQVSAATNEHVLTKDTTTGDAIWKAASGGGGGSGTVTSVNMSVPTGFAISGNPITGSGTLALAFASGYSLPTTTKQGQWDTAYGWGDHSAAGYLTSAITSVAPITLDTSNNRVGINEASPDYDLHVHGSGNYTVKFEHGEGQTLFNKYGHIQIFNDNATPFDGATLDDPVWQIGQRDGGQLDIALGNISTQLVPASKKVMEFKRVGNTESGAIQIGFFGSTAASKTAVAALGAQTAASPAVPAPPGAGDTLHADFDAAITQLNTNINAIQAKLDALITSLSNLGLV